jgi:hypothetical protein
MKTWGSGGIAPPFLTLALDGGEWSLDGPQSQSRSCGEEKNILPLPGIEPQFLGYAACSSLCPKYLTDKKKK